MSRYDESIGPVPNPSQYYLEWNQELSSFSYWDKDSSERREYPLPFKFAALKFMNSISGFDDNRKQGIFSNEISDTRSERFRVLYRDGVELAQGYYADIKDQVNGVGGRFTRSIYAVTPKGVIVNIKLKGTQMVNFGVIEKFGKRWQDEWIEVKDFEIKTTKDGKEYSVPVFSFSKSLSDSEIRGVDSAYKVVKHYFDSKAPVHYATKSQQPAAEESAPFTVLDNDDLPF